jgi:4-hydroxy-4-methyl-2-oxoglutarate aldolase
MAALTDADAFDQEAIRVRFLAVDTSNVADVLDTLGYLDQGLSPEFTPFTAPGGRLAGWAYTIRGQMTPYPLGGDAEKMVACGNVGSGSVTVWSGDGNGICYFGELIALGMKERGCVGAVVDGGIRDIRWLREAGFPVFARYRTPVQSIGRWKVTGAQVPVYAKGATTTAVRIDPGDFILGDDDGVIVIPRAHVITVLEQAEALTRKEVQIRRDLGGGLSLADALARYGHV